MQYDPRKWVAKDGVVYQDGTVVAACNSDGVALLIMRMAHSFMQGHEMAQRWASDAPFDVQKSIWAFMIDD